jgi:hypothetical protein
LRPVGYGKHPVSKCHAPRRRNHLR